MRPPNRSWRVDETYVRVAGVWTYLYRAVDSAGETIVCAKLQVIKEEVDEEIFPAD
jgi:transposase-like protein